MARTGKMGCICRADLWDPSVPLVWWFLGAAVRWQAMKQVLVCAIRQLHQAKSRHKLINYISRWPKYNFWVSQGSVSLLVLMNGLEGDCRQQMWWWNKMIKSNKSWRKSDKIKRDLIKLDKWAMQQQVKRSVARKFTPERMMLTLFIHAWVLHFALKRSGLSTDSLKRVATQSLGVMSNAV